MLILRGAPALSAFRQSIIILQVCFYGIAFI
ncbi:hypothetical protein, partial [Pseudomonas sp. NPDC079367]